MRELKLIETQSQNNNSNNNASVKNENISNFTRNLLMNKDKDIEQLRS